MNFKITPKKLTIGTQKLKRKRPQDNIKIIKSLWKRLKEKNYKKF